MRNCKYCGMEMYDDDLFCTRCGKRVEEETAGPDGAAASAGAAVAGAAVAGAAAVTGAAGTAGAGSSAGQPDGTAGGKAEGGGKTAAAKKTEGGTKAAAAKKTEKGTKAAAAKKTEEGRKTAGSEKAQEGKKTAGAEAAASGAAVTQPKQPARAEKGEKKPLKAGAAKKIPERREQKDEDRNTFLPLAFAAILILLLGLFLPRLFRGTPSPEQPSAQTAQDEAAGQETGDIQEAAGSDGQETVSGAGPSEQSAGTETQGAADAAEASGDQNPTEGQQTAEGTPAEEKDTAGSPEEQQAEKDQEAGEDSAGTAGEYILAEADSRYYTPDEVADLDDETLQMAINELCARHGRIFSADDTRSYFESKSWYKGTIDAETFDANLYTYFNEFEAANFSMLAGVRESRASASQAQPAQEEQAPEQSETAAPQSESDSQRPEPQSEGNWDDNSLYNVDTDN